MDLSIKLIGVGINKFVPTFAVILLFGCGGKNTSKEFPPPTINENKLIGIYKLDAEELAHSAGVSVEFFKKTPLFTASRIVL